MSRSYEKICNNCGSIRSGNDTFCGHCGETFGNSGSEATNFSLFQGVSPRGLPQRPLVSKIFSQPQSHKIYRAVIAVLVLTLGFSSALGIILIYKVNII